MANLDDWLAPGKDVRYMAMHNGPVSNAFVINDLRIMASVAEHLGKTGDAERYRTQQKASTEAYVSAFVSEDGSMRVDYQGVYVMALALVLPKGDLWNSVFAKLVGKLKTEGMQTDFFATLHLLSLLAENGEETLVFDLLFQENCPGWMYEVNKTNDKTCPVGPQLGPTGRAFCCLKPAEDDIPFFCVYTCHSKKRNRQRGTTCRQVRTNSSIWLREGSFGSTALCRAWAFGPL